MSSSQDDQDSIVDVSTPYTPRRPSPLVSISVNHPLANLARKIKNFLTHKQTLFSTSFTIKITPIVALVSFLGVAALFGGGITTAYNFGKSVGEKFLSSSAMSPTPVPSPMSNATSPLIVSKSGTIKSTYQLPQVTPTVIANEVKQSPSNDQIASSSSPRNDEPTPTPTLAPVLHYILVSRNGTINYLNASGSVKLQNYLNLRVLVTGTWDSTKNTLSVQKPEDIEILQ